MSDSLRTVDRALGHRLDLAGGAAVLMSSSFETVVVYFEKSSYCRNMTSTSSIGTSIHLDSVIIATDQPATMADWYATVLGASRESDNVVRHETLQIIVFPHDAVTGASVQPERMMLNFHVADVARFTAHVDGLGMIWKRPFEPEEFGMLATLEDPDGNYVQFLKLNETDS